MSARGFAKLERYELKYHVPLALLGELESFLKPWCNLDEHSEDSDDGFYWVTSLYLDSPRWTFFRWKESGMSDRFNMRIRTYGENPSASDFRFFEVKQKSGDIVTKTRGVLKGIDPAMLWNDPRSIIAKAPLKQRKNLERFYVLSTTYNASPVLLTQYRRRAWFGIHEEYARVTIDVGMRWREEHGFDYRVNALQMNQSDLPEYFQPGTNAVLELKCPKAEVPWWMLDLIRYLNLQRTSFSKYGAAVREALRIPTIRTAGR